MIQPFSVLKIQCQVRKERDNRSEIRGREYRLGMGV